MSDVIRCKDVLSEENGGIFLGEIFAKGKSWAIVLWDGMLKPDIYPAESLLVEAGKWVPLAADTWNFMDTASAPVRCRVQNTEVGGQEGEFFGVVVVDNMPWAVIRWDDDKDPDLYKAAVIQIEKMEWEPLVKT